MQAGERAEVRGGAAWASAVAYCYQRGGKLQPGLDQGCRYALRLVRKRIASLMDTERAEAKSEETWYALVPLFGARKHPIRKASTGDGQGLLWGPKGQEPIISYRQLRG